MGQAETSPSGRIDGFLTLYTHGDPRNSSRLRTRTRRRHSSQPRDASLALLGCLALALACGEEASSPPGSVTQGESGAPQTSLRVERERLDTTVWQTETLARQYEQRLVSLWDDLLDAGRREKPMAKFQILADLEP
ncbi:MAG: hypothetical protein NZ990_10205, partial [Myxococcota bacterium]|nr:hypothetical protein [Myxococcota bacterium]